MKFLKISHVGYREIMLIIIFLFKDPLRH